MEIKRNHLIFTLVCLFVQLASTYHVDETRYALRPPNGSTDREHHIHKRFIKIVSTNPGAEEKIVGGSLIPHLRNALKGGRVSLEVNLKRPREMWDKFKAYWQKRFPPKYKSWKDWKEPIPTYPNNGDTNRDNPVNTYPVVKYSEEDLGDNNNNPMNEWGMGDGGNDEDTRNEVGNPADVPVADDEDEEENQSVDDVESTTVGENTVVEEDEPVSDSGERGRNMASREELSDDDEHMNPETNENFVEDDAWVKHDVDPRRNRKKVWEQDV